jgi:hypothetical protein
MARIERRKLTARQGPDPLLEALARGYQARLGNPAKEGEQE